MTEYKEIVKKKMLYLIRYSCMHFLSLVILTRKDRSPEIRFPGSMDANKYKNASYAMIGFQSVFCVPSSQLI